MKIKPLLLIIVLAIIAHDANAKYDRHDGSNYSCNIIWTERAYAKNTQQQNAAKSLDEELKQFCPGYYDE